MPENSLDFSKHAVHTMFSEDYNKWFWLCTCGRIGSDEFDDVVEEEARIHLEGVKES